MALKYKILFTKQFEKSFSKLTNSEKQKTREVIKLLSQDIALPKNFRDCHIKDNLVLLYQKDNDILTITAVNIGSHAKVLGL